MATVLPSVGIEVALPVFAKWAKPDGLDRFVVGSVSIIAAASLGGADRVPPGRSIDAAVEAGLFDEGFDEGQFDVIVLLPVLGQSLSHQGEEMGAEIGQAGPGEDQEAVVVAHSGEIGLALFAGPSDEVVARGELPGGGAEAEQGQGTAVLGRMVGNQSPQGGHVPNGEVPSQIAALDGLPGVARSTAHGGTKGGGLRANDARRLDVMVHGS